MNVAWPRIPVYREEITKVLEDTSVLRSKDSYNKDFNSVLLDVRTSLDLCINMKEQ